VKDSWELGCLNTNMAFLQGKWTAVRGTETV
jgi:hypothetical protein